MYPLRAPRGRDYGAVLGGHAGGRAAFPCGMASMKFHCERCGDSGWCCEEHPAVPMGHRFERGGECGAAGIPCSICNTAEPPHPSNRRRHVSGEWIIQD